MGSSDDSQIENSDTRNTDENDLYQQSSSIHSSDDAIESETERRPENRIDDISDISDEQNRVTDEEDSNQDTNGDSSHLPTPSPNSDSTESYNQAPMEEINQNAVPTATAHDLPLHSSILAACGHLEVVFSFDTTGSMCGYLDAVRGRLQVR